MSLAPRLKRISSICGVSLLALFLGGCEKRDLPLIGVLYESNRGGEVALQAPRPRLEVVKAKAPLPPREIERLMKEHPLILECHCTNIEELSRQEQKPRALRRDYSLPREESERRQALAAQRGITVLVERRLTFRICKTIKGQCPEAEVRIDDRDCAIRFENRDEGFFYLRTAETAAAGCGAFRYGLFFDRPTLAESSRLTIVRMPLSPAKPSAAEQGE